MHANTATLREQDMGEWGLVGQTLLGTGGGGVIVAIAWQMWKKYVSGSRADVASNDANTRMFERLEQQLERSLERETASSERADKAERELTKALGQIDQLTWTVGSLRDQVQNLEKKLEAYATRRDQA